MEAAVPVTVQVLRSADRAVLLCKDNLISRAEYHEKLNVIVAGTIHGEIYVMDPNLGDVLYSAKVAEMNDNWDFSVGSDRIAIATKGKLGLRSDYNGILLLNTILQTPVTANKETVEIELTKMEAELLCQALAIQSLKVQDTELKELLQYLKSQLLQAKERDEPKPDSSTFSVKREKWNTIVLKYNHSSMKTVLQGIMNEFLKRTQYNPQLSIASSILERLNALLPTQSQSQETTDKSSMFSEAARVNTFMNWPHRDYKWAHPVKMAQAGFYHSPSSTGEDRAMCFTCNVCLVSWEPTDEPWSEHERHSPFCPFVRGEHTHNVPLSLSYSTSPAIVMTKKPHETAILGKSTCPNALPMCYMDGLIVIWDTLKQSKEVFNFEVTTTDLQDLDPMSIAGYSDIDLKPKQAWVEDIPTPKSLSVSEADCLQDFSRKVQLRKVALISSPTPSPHVHVPPSLVVAGGSVTWEGEYIESWILVFSLSPTILTAEDDVFEADAYEMETGGTKKETPHYEDELFGPFLSESDIISESMVSDSLTVFSESNMSESSYIGLFPPSEHSVPPPSTSSATKQLTPSASWMEKAFPKSKPGSTNSSVTIVQKLSLPDNVKHCQVRLLEPTPEKNKVVVILRELVPDMDKKYRGAILVYEITVNEANIVMLSSTPIQQLNLEDELEIPIRCCFIPMDMHSMSVAFALDDGSARIYSLTDLRLQFVIHSPMLDDPITSLVYCSSIEKLWCGTAQGYFLLYSIGLNESDEDNLTQFESETAETDGTPRVQSDLILNKPLNTASLQQLRQLTKFENIKLPFCVNTPACWQKIIQAQKERKHPLHLHSETDWTQSSFSWRLQRNKDSKKEHLFEITFPKTANVGHIDFKFSLQPGCTTLLPFEITLYMARSKRGGTAVDAGVDFSPQMQMSNRSLEFLKSANAEIVCGPLQLANHLDITAQSGLLVMTSPMLLLSKGRSYFLHVKATKHGRSESTGSSKEQKLPSPKKAKSAGSGSGSSKCPKMKSSSVGSSYKKYHPFMSKDFFKAFNFTGKDTTSLAAQIKAASRSTILEEMEKKRVYEGCDWLHEISLTVRQVKECPLPNSELERKAMLTSPEFVRRLLQVVTFGGTEVSFAAQSIALDLLNWIAGIKLCGPQLGSGRYQVDFIEAIEQCLSGLILKCILLADRSTAHKCAKLLILCFDVVEVYHKKAKEITFLKSLVKNLIHLLPFTLQCTSAGALQWYFLLLNQVRTVDPSLVSESMLEMLNIVSKELLARTDPLHAILRSRFGLYGTPFDPDLFDLEETSLPKLTLPSRGNANGPNGPTHGEPHTFGPEPPPPPAPTSKDFDFRDLLLGNPLRHSKVVSPKQQIHGLIEVEALHFTCHAASDGARVEKMDLGGSSTFSPMPMPQSWEPFTNVATGEGSKKSDLYKSLSKLEKMKMIDHDAYCDYLKDVKMLEGNLNLIDMMTFQTSSDVNPNAHGFIPGMLQDSAGNSYNAFIHQSQLPTQIPKTFKVAAPILKPYTAQTDFASLDKKIRGQIDGKSPKATTSKGDEGLRLLMSPWQQMMYVPTQQALVVDRMHSGARRYVVLDFGCPILLTDLLIPPCPDLASLSIDMWLKREDMDGQRLVVASDIACKPLIFNDIQPPPICRYLKVTTIGRYGMGTMKCKIPLGMFYGHSAILPNDIEIDGSEPRVDLPVLSPVSTPAHLSILAYVLEDIGCRYQLACGKLKRLLEPLAKPEIASIDHISYFLPKGKERAKLGLSSGSDQTILASYQECITLQQQLNVTKNVIFRLQRSLEPYAAILEVENPMSLLPKVPTDKIRLLSTFIVESLLGISFMSSNKILETIPYPLYSNMTQSACSDLFLNICVLENTQFQHAACTFLLRTCGFQPWWGNFLTSTLKNLFSSTNTSVFPQDRLFTLMVYLSQRVSWLGQKATVVESTMKLLEEIVSSGDESPAGFTRAKIDMNLLGWTVMFLCLSLDGMTHSALKSEEGRKLKRGRTSSIYIASRWNFIQGESILHESLTDNLKSSGSTSMKRRISKKIATLKQKVNDIEDLPSDYSSNVIALAPLPGAQNLNAKNVAKAGWKLDPGGLFVGKGTTAKSLQDLLLGKDKRDNTPPLKSGREGNEVSDIELNLNLNSGLCYSLSKALGSFLLKMDSTCHSDIYLLLCKALARISTACRPAMRLGEIFTEGQILQLVQTGVGNDFVNQVNWSSSWISHAIMCLIQDLLDGENRYPESSERKMEMLTTEELDRVFFGTSRSHEKLSEPMMVDATDVDGESDGLQTVAPSQSSSATTMICVESESDYESLDEYYPFGSHESKVMRSSRLAMEAKDQSQASGLMSSLDSRLDSGIDCSTEIRLRMISAIQAEVVVRSLGDGVEVPAEVLRNVTTRLSSGGLDQPILFGDSNSWYFLSLCFDELFRMMAHENCSVNIEKVLLFWLNIGRETIDTATCQPKLTIPLDPAAISGLIAALARNVGIGVEDWGLGLKCLGRLVNQQPSARISIPVAIMTDPNFPEMILKFISGSGMNLMRNHVPAMGPTLCEDFDLFFSRLFSSIKGMPWVNYLLELLLRVLSEFVSGPLLGSEFPLDAFNKFLDIFMRFEQDLTTTNAAVLISVVSHVSHALHRHVCFPNKVAVKSNAELKGAPAATTSNGLPLIGSISESFRKPHDTESLLVRLLSLLSDIITIRKKSAEGAKEQEKKLREINFPRDLATFEEFVEEYGTPGSAGKVDRIADLVVQMDTTMMRLFSVLANPKGKSNLLEEEVSHASTFCTEAMPLRIPDFMIRLISRLMSSLTDQKQIVQPLFKFLAKSPYEDYCCPLIVSQMFIRTILKVIKEEANLEEFVRTNCIQSICQKLVASSKQFFSSCPTFASILMQYIGRAESTSLFGQRRFGNELADLSGGVINVAPLGTITSLNFSAHPSEVLLQASPPHRRARAPVWSYHFYPEETFLELVITLPCAILLKEIQIVPHISSLASKLSCTFKPAIASSPSAVMIEISKERQSTLVAKSPPVQCSGMTAINIQLTQPEVGQTVLLRLYKPKDSNTLGLSQIKILGCTTFCESAFEGLSQQHVAKNVQSSAQWMYILDHAITAAKPELRSQIIGLAVNIPDILQACYSMLMCPTSGQDGQESYLPHVSSVLFHFGSLSDINEQLMDALLGPVQLALSHGMTAHTNVQSIVFGSSQLNTVVELIYKLCCAVPTNFGCNNLTTVIHWLEKCADEAVADASQSHQLVPEYVQSIAAALWSVTVERKVDVSDLVTARLLLKLLNWSKCLNLKSELKAAVDHMLCSMCYNKPWLFVYLNFEMGFLEFECPEDVELQSPAELIAIWYEEKSICERLKLKNLDTAEVICSPLLMTLARAAHSEPAATFVFECGLLTKLNDMIIQFLNNQTLHLTGSQPPEAATNFISTPQLIAILEFYGELCSITRFKDWFGTEGSVFWNPILQLLSMVPSNMKASCFGSHLYELEYIVIQYLARCCWSHPENQTYIAKRLSEMIVTQKQSPHKAVFLHSLSSFCRRLLIQVLLENEKMVVHVKNYTTTNFKSPVTSLPLKDRHPSMGVNGKDRIFLASIPSTAYDLMKLLDPAAVTLVEKTPTTNINLKKACDPGIAGWNLGMAENVHEIAYPGGGYHQGPMAYNMEDDVLQEILGFETVVKMGMKAKKARGEKTQEVMVVVPEPERYRPKFVLEAEEFPDVKIPLGLNLSKVKAVIREQNPGYFLELLVLVARKEVAGPVPVSETSSFTAMDVDDIEVNADTETVEKVPDIFKIPALPTTIEVFCRVGGFGLLAKHLPVIYPDTLRQMSVGSKSTGTAGTTSGTDKGGPLLVVDNDWVKLENPEEFYEENDAGVLDNIVPSPMQSRAFSIKPVGSVPGIPPHSMAAFGLFLGLPKYSEVLLRERVGAQCMLRLAMGVTDDADGNDIFCSAVAKTLPTLPFQVLNQLLDLLSLKSDEGKHVRQAMFECKAIHFILACLAIFTHQPCDPVLVPSVQHELVLAATKAQGEYPGKCDKSDDKSHVYWAKGTGFGTGSTQETWNVERAMEKRVAEEENVTCLLLVLSSYICPQVSSQPALFSSPTPSSSSLVELPQELEELLQISCLFTTISLYLKNDSVLDMARHIPLYTAVLQFLRSILHIPQLVPLLDQKKSKSSGRDDQKISTLLHQMKTIVDSYSKRLQSNAKKGAKSKSNENKVDELQDEGLAKLIEDIKSTATLVEVALKEECPESTGDEDGFATAQIEKTLEDVYLEEMKKLQFAFFEMLVEEEESVSGVRFTVSHFYENSIRTNWSRSAPARLKRLAQESITLSTSLPIAFGSTIFVRCDTDRLDVMKVLITGPAGTPYSNGCFEFDVYFPMEYPNGPMLIHLQTTGRQRIRFNPNLYADGKVCLSILNTWHGRPEEKWNAQTSSLLPVLVAIQSLILNAEPYFNEPGYEKSRGTDGGEKSSREYNAGIQIATLEWAMLDQIRHPSVCFKDVIHKHFWLKRNEILSQCEQWYEELVVTCRNDKRVGKSITGNSDPVTVFKNNLSLLRKELQNMTPPAGLEFLADSLPQNLESELGSAESSTSSNSVFETSMDGTAGGATESGPTPVVFEEFVESDVAVMSILNNLPEAEDGGDLDEPMLTDSETS